MDEYFLFQSDNTVHANALEYQQVERMSSHPSAEHDSPRTNPPHKPFDNPQVYLLSLCSLPKRQTKVKWCRVKALMKRNALHGGSFTRSEADLAGKGG